MIATGQEKFSYAWDSKTKLFKAGEISDAPENFVEGDVIGAYAVSCVVNFEIVFQIIFKLLWFLF
jgi:hypothetical protein